MKDDLKAFAALCFLIGLVVCFLTAFADAADPTRNIELPAWKFGNPQNIEPTLFPENDPEQRP
jgi:hypothetical protein